MAFDIGLDFRASSGFVTDGTNCFFADLLTYPQSVGGTSVGWDNTGSMEERDRQSGNDPRLAGMHRVGSNQVRKYRVDLPNAGNYEIRLALGDPDNTSANMYFRVLDDTTEVISLQNVSTTGGNRFLDAVGTQYTNATWPGSNTAVLCAFATTTLYIEGGNASAGTLSHIAHIRITEIPPSGFNVGPTAFQGFQSDAFQGQGGYAPKRIDTAFQQDAFQGNAFQIFGGTIAGSGTNVDAQSRSLTLAAFAATVAHDKNVSATSASLTLTPFAAAFTRNVDVTPASRALTLATNAALVSDDKAISAESRELTLTANAADVVLVIETVVSVLATQLTLTAFSAFVEGTRDSTGSGPGADYWTKHRLRLLEDDETILRVIREYFGPRS